MKAIFGQKASATGNVGPRLRAALRWWQRVLSLGVSETRKWGQSRLSTCFLFVDAASAPARCAAVLMKDGMISYTASPPRQDWMRQLARRGDNQILSLEILAIMVALSTFGDDLSGRNVVLYSDNVGAECATRKGDAKAFDHNQLVHEIWTHALLMKFNLWIERVPSKENISDSPSRFDYELLHDLGAKWHKPVLAEVYLGTPH